MSKQFPKIASLMLATSLCLSAFIMPVRAETIGSNNVAIEAASYEGIRQTVQIASAVATIVLIAAFIASLRWLIKVGADERWQKTAINLTLSLGIVMAIASAELLIATFFWDTIGPFGTAKHFAFPWIVVAPAMVYRGMRCKAPEVGDEDFED